uniref:Endo/exonuclease/phosphatase domain-containing protein n=1 Tax=Strongyloides papillosus TaxID=174720 RepID=A0A0N5BZD0_STREA
MARNRVAKDITIKLGYLNARFLTSKGKIFDLITEIKNNDIDIMFIAETKSKISSNFNVDHGKLWIGEGKMNKINEKSTGVSGEMAIYVKNNINIYKLKIYNNRIAVVQQLNNKVLTTYIGIYAPTDDNNDETKNKFFAEVNEVIELSINEDKKNKDIIVRKPVILGDFNGYIGRNKMKNIHGGYYMCSEVNDNGTRLLELAMKLNISVINTYYKRRNSSRFSWSNTSKTQRSEIDYIVGERKLITNFRILTFSQFFVNSDHRAISSKYQIPKVILRRRKMKLNGTVDIDVANKIDWNFTCNSTTQKAVDEESMQLIQKIKRTLKPKDKDEKY